MVAYGEGAGTGGDAFIAARLGCRVGQNGRPGAGAWLGGAQGDAAFRDQHLDTAVVVDTNRECRAHRAHECPGSLDIKRPQLFVSDGEVRLPTYELAVAACVCQPHAPAAA